MVSVVRVFNLVYVIDEETDKRGHKRRGRLTRLSRIFHKQRPTAACAEVEEKQKEEEEEEEEEEGGGGRQQGARGGST